MNDNTSTLSKLRKVILSLQKEGMAHMQQLHGDALKQIVTIAKENNLTIDHIQVAMCAKTPKTDRTLRLPRKNKKSRTDGTHDAVLADASVQ